MLFSTTTLSQFFTIGSSGSKSSIDKHHIFPKNYLAKIGFDDDRDRNQIASFTYIDYPTNIEISDDPPADYVERFKKSLEKNSIRQAVSSMPCQSDLKKWNIPSF